MSRFISIALMCLVLLATLYAVQAASQPLTEEHFRNEFGSFVVKFKRDYSSEIEYETRFQIFKANILNAYELNKESTSATFGVTKFSDWTTAERQAFLGKLPANRSSRLSAPKPSPAPLAAPTSFDLTKKGVIPAAKNQGQCGSCWAFSTVFGIESAALKEKIFKSPEEIDLSPQQLVDCCSPRSQCDGCQGGDLPPAYESLSVFGGSVSSASYPYTGRDGTCKQNKTEIAVKVDGFEWIIPTCEGGDCGKVDSQTFLARIQEKGQSGSVCVYASQWFDYTGGVFDLSCTNSYYSLNHCVGGIVEYSAEDGYVTIMNSWGDDWGIEGKMRLKYDPSSSKYNNLCGVFSEGAFAQVSKP